jgi:hypothetical protein
MTRMLAAAAALITIFLLFIFLAGGTSFAQQPVTDKELVDGAVAAVATTSTWADMISLIRESATASLLAAATAGLAWLSTKVQKWFGVQIDLRETMEAIEWRRHLTEGSNEAFDYAQLKTGITPDKIKTREEKDDFLGHALRYMEEFNDDIVLFLDKNGNNVLDILETRLVKIAPDAFPVEPQPAVMARRASRAATADVAARFAAKPAGRA